MDEDAPHSSVDSGTTAAGVGVPAPLPLSVNSQADIVIPMDNHDATPMKFHSNSLIIGPRAERTAKFLLGLVASLVVGYKAPEWFGWNFTYSIPLFYCMAGALLPPKVSTISLLWSLAFPAGLLVAGWVTLICWLALFADSENGRAHVMCWGYVLLVMMASLLKTGPLAALNQIPLMIMAYGGHLGLFYLFTFVREGAVMKSMTRGEIMLLEGEIVALYPKLEMYIKMLFIKIFAMMDSISPGGDPLSAVIPVPAFFEQISSDFRFMMGEGMHIEVYHDFIRATLPPDPWILRVFWHATDMLCTGQAIIIGGSVALGILTTTLLLPPQRYMRSFLRTEMTSVTSTISAWMQFFADDDVPTPSGTPRNPMKCLSSVKGVERVARMLQDARMDPMAPRMRRLASDTDPEIELLRLSESLNKLSAAVLLSTFEASLRHPGIFSFYVPQLVKVLANLQSLPPHMLMCTRVGAQLNDGHFGAEIHTRLLGDVRFGNTLHDAADLLHMTAVAISTKPVNSGAAFFAYCQTKHNLHEAIFRHVTHRSAIRNRVTRSLHESVDNPLVYWRNALTESILLLTYEGAVIEKPLKLAHSVLELMEAQQKE
ncbi:MAG: uncharacterized protein KVP18_003138 [Porospora cf. gigantea A]|nr:MAG: hypothetical protein KVP18_003138 [Porospora cf. gigantea A]